MNQVQGVGTAWVRIQGGSGDLKEARWKLDVTRTFLSSLEVDVVVMLKSTCSVYL